jgi:MFS family permease
MTAAALPRALLMLLGGSVSDRFPPRKVMITTASSRAVCLICIAILMWLHLLRLWELYLLAAAFGIADAFAFPAHQAFLPSVVESEQLVAANATIQSTIQFATVTGSAPAGEVVRKFGAAWAFFLDGLSFLFIIAALWTLPDAPRAPSPAKQSTLLSIAEGFRYVKSDLSLRTLVLLEAILNFCMFGPTMVGLAYLARQRFASPASYGIWLSALAAGNVAGALLAGMYRQRRNGIVWILLTVACGACMVFIPWSGHLWAPAIDLFVVGALKGILNVQITAWIQKRVHRSLLGRVASVQMFSGFGLTPFSLAIAGIVVQWSIYVLFSAAGILTILVTGIAALQRSIREIE